MNGDRSRLDGTAGMVGMMAVAIGAAGCAIAIERDLTTTPPSQVVFDDLCGLQDYYDTLTLKKAAPPQTEITTEIENTDRKVARGGRSRYVFETDYQLGTLRKILMDNYKRIPDEALAQKPVKLEVMWAEKAGIRRLVTDHEAELSVGTTTWSLPPHPCLSELLFGEPLYRTRRSLLGLPDLNPVPSTPARTQAPVAGRPNGNPDGGPFGPADAAVKPSLVGS